MIDAILSPAEARSLIRECATVVKPGETLIIRLPVETPPSRIAEYRAVLDEMRTTFGLTAIVVAAAELGVVQADTDEVFAGRVMAAINALDVRAAVYNGAGGEVSAQPRFWVGEERMAAPAFLSKGCGVDGCGCADDPAIP